MRADADRRLAAVARLLDGFRRRCVENGAAFPLDLTEALTLASGASGRHAAPNVACSTVDDQPLLMTYRAVATALSVSERQVDRLVASGALPTVAVGRAARVRRADVEAFVASLPLRRSA